MPSRNQFYLIWDYFTTLRNNCRWLKSPPDRWERDFPSSFQLFATSSPIQTFTAIFWMCVPTRNQFQLIRKGFCYIYKLFQTFEKPARTRRGRSSAVFLARRYKWDLSKINYKFSNSCAVSKPILSYLGRFLLPCAIIIDDCKARQAPGHAIFRHFFSVLRRAPPFRRDTRLAIFHRFYSV